MLDNNILFSVIIPKIPGGFDTAVDSVKNTWYPQEKIEVLLVEGYQPSVQRNKGAECAKGDVLCFLDNDCRVTSEFFNEIMKGFHWNNDEKITVVGGPSLVITGDSLLKKSLSYALSSYFAHFRMRARYKSIGKIRESNEKELIGCNLCIKRPIFEKLNGFNEKLYPNEENEFLNRLRIKLNNHKIIYNPNAIVYREIRFTLSRFVKKFFKYGGGRAKEICSEPLKLNFIYFIPLLLLLYLIGLIFIHKLYYLIFLGIYIIGAFISSSVVALKEKRMGLFFTLPFIYFIMHISYGVGMSFGFIKKWFKFRMKKTDKVEVRVKKIKQFDRAWE